MLSLCLSVTVEVYVKMVERSSWFIEQSLPLECHTFCYKRAAVAPQIRLCNSSIKQTLPFSSFLLCHSLDSAVVNDTEQLTSSTALDHHCCSLDDSFTDAVI